MKTKTEITNMFRGAILASAQICSDINPNLPPMLGVSVVDNEQVSAADIIADARGRANGAMKIIDACINDGTWSGQEVLDIIAVRDEFKYALSMFGEIDAQDMIEKPEKFTYRRWLEQNLPK